MPNYAFILRFAVFVVFLSMRLGRLRVSQRYLKGILIYAYSLLSVLFCKNWGFAE